MINMGYLKAHQNVFYDEFFSIQTVATYAELHVFNDVDSAHIFRVKSPTNSLLPVYTYVQNLKTS